MDTSQIVVPILGMHRSGTSMVTRALHHMGMEVGGPLQPPAPDNPRGFWENRFFQGLNMRLLGSQGCQVDGFDKSVAIKKASRLLGQMPLNDQLLAPVADYLQKSFKGPLWGFKDPRTVITWPFWSRVFAALGFEDIRPVIVMRHPDACARSLVSRGTFEGGVAGGKELHAQAVALWQIYSKLMQAYLGEKALILFQEDLIDPAKASGELSRLAAYLEVEEAWVAVAHAAIDRGLVHQSREAEPISDGSAGRTYAFFQQEKQKRDGVVAVSQRLPAVTAPRVGTYSIYIASPEKYGGVHAFDEHALCLHHAFRQLGHTVPIVRRTHEIVGTPIVFGANMLEGPAPEGSIIYNLEQIREPSPWLQPAYLDLLRQHRVWDYSQQNREALAGYGITDVALCEVGYMPALCGIQQWEESAKDIDVLFYGSINERRQKILQALQDSGIRLRHETRCYGKRRDALIARAKVVINFHYYPAKVLEIVRLSYLWANGVFVVCERGEDANLEQPYEEGVAFCDYDGLVETCLRYLVQPEERARIAQRGREIFASHDQATYLAAALDP